MRTESTSKHSLALQDIIHILMLSAVTLVIGLYLISTTVMIAKDGVTFIQYAQELEAAPIQTMITEFQHPGYPWLILLAHKVSAPIHKDSSVLGWVYCAQAVTLIFRILAIVPFYYLGKRLTDSRSSYLAVLIFILLPGPAEYGSDALSDWPHLFFFLIGLLLLLIATSPGRWWVYGLAGLAAGAGYLVRPECAQLGIFGGSWLVLQMFRPRRSISRAKVLMALVLLVVGFSVLAVPYMKLKGALLPKKSFEIFGSEDKQLPMCSSEGKTRTESRYLCSTVPFKIAEALGRLLSNFGEVMMWFFLPALLIGTYIWLKACPWYKPERFFVIAVIVLNVPLLVWLYCKYGYISNRHTLPLLVTTALFVPAGLERLTAALQKMFSGKSATQTKTVSNRKFLFALLLIIGITICLPKLLRPIRVEKRGYREAAEWLKANTNSEDTIAVPDKRISFYAQRQGQVYEDEDISSDAVYIVILSKDQKDKTALMEPPGKVEYKYVAKSKRRVNVIIYRRM